MMHAPPESAREGLGLAASLDYPAPSPVFRRRDLLSIAILIASIVAMFWRVIFTPAMFFYRDVFNYTYPTARFIHEMCRHGQLPYWNPYLNYGEPLLANPNFLFFYPYTLVIVLLPAAFAYTMHYIAHFAIAAVGTYCLARRWAQSRAAAFVAAFFFIFSGPVLSLGSFYNHSACAAWMPWALLATACALEGRRLRPWILLALVFTLQFLAGEPFTLLATFALCLVYALYSQRGGWELSARIVLIFLLEGLCVVALAAVQFLPSFDLLSRSRRGMSGLPFFETTYWSLHPLSLLEFVFPSFFGSPIDAQTTWTGVLGCHNVPYFPSLFLGFVPLFLALVGWALGRDRRRGFASWAAVTLLALALGRFTPVFALAYLLLPPLALVRSPIKLLVPAFLLIAILAGWGVDALRQFSATSRRVRRAILIPLACLLALVILTLLVGITEPGWIATPAARVLVRTDNLFRGSAKALSSVEVAAAATYLVTMLKLYLPGLAGFALGGILWMKGFERGNAWARRAIPAACLIGMGQLVLANYSANPTVPKTFYTYRPPVTEQPASEPYRYCFIQSDPFSAGAEPDAQRFLNFDSIPAARGFSIPAEQAFRDRLLLERGSMLAGVEASQNTDLDGSLPPEHSEFWLFALRGTPDLAHHDCLLGRTNVKYLIRAARQPSAATREVTPIFNGSGEPSYLYEDACFLPRALVAGEAVYSRSSHHTLSLLADPAFQARDNVILPVAAETSSLPQSLPPSETARETSGAAPDGTVDIIERQPNAVTLRARLDRPGYVVLLDRYDSDWHATLDGREVPILEADHMFRAVRAGAGEHVIRFYYVQRGLAAGVVITVVMVLLLGALFAANPTWPKWLHGLTFRS
ncbi:MAG TPA: YfhO family protein [Terriglobia bacterium]|nr:YfhO family protein [Terriglobia bacterium]